ncbi:MAG: T9SS type A sorting domain-containing protein [Bacteroidetes bacterium]|jgi:GH35 family endo-1,4-beta-xylanase|nr:T9SS type A sorting domain-containing protein [Bacteroidota bacterium]
MQTVLRTNIPLGLLLISVLLGAMAQQASAQEDAYHQWLRDQLEQDHGVTGGAWALGATEAAAFDPVYPVGVTEQMIDVPGQPFTRAVRFEVASVGANPWDRAAYLPIEQAISEGDVLLLVVWIRSLNAERGDGAVRSIIGENQPPFRQPVSQLQLMTGEWQQWLLPFEADLDLPVGQGQYGLQMGFMEQTLELGGLALINYGDAYAVDDLPRTDYDLDYAGRDPGAAWRAEAQARIEQHRMADLEVHVVDGEGQPIEGAQVEVALQQHAFGFGTAVSIPTVLQSDADAQTYREKLDDLTGDGRSFNYVVIENGLKWPPWEGLASWYTPTQAQTVDVVNQLHEQGKRVRGHVLLWPSWSNMPRDLQQNQNDLAFLRQRVSGHIEALAGHPDLQAPIVEWDVLNEPTHLLDLQEAFGELEDIADEYAAWFNEAAEAAPAAATYINEYSIISQAGIDLQTQERYKEVIRAIQDAGGQIDGIGVQGHVHTPLAPPEAVYEILDEYAALADELSITEYDAVDVPEDLAADYLRDLLTIAFSHPSVHSFLMWGFWDGNHWRDDAAMFREDWSLKPSGQAFLDLVFDQWWTDETGTTGNQGAVEVRGFLGTYEVTVRLDGMTVTEAVTLTGEGATVEVVLVGAAPTVTTPIPDATLTAGGDPFTQDLSGVFTDPDGDPLTFTASSSDEAIATAAVDGSTLTVTPRAVGEATITVTAADGNGGTAETAFAVTVPTGVATEDEADVPEAFALDAAYPNPFNPQTTIGYVLPEAAEVRLVVYDVLGRQVAVLVEGVRPAGRHQVTFEATDLTTGVYLYRLDAGAPGSGPGQAFTQTRRMLLVK